MMHVFGCRTERFEPRGIRLGTLGNLNQRRERFFQFGICENADLFKSDSPNGVNCNFVRQEPAIKRKRALERVELRHLAHARSVRPTAGRLSVRSCRFLDELLFATFGLCLRAHGYGQRKQIDETLGILGVCSGHGETGEVRAIKREGRNALGDVERTLPEFQADGAGYALLCDVEESVERFA